MTHNMFANISVAKRNYIIKPMCNNVKEIQSPIQDK